MGHVDLELWQRALLLALWALPGSLGYVFSRLVSVRRHAFYLAVAAPSAVGVYVLIESLLNTWSIERASHIHFGMASLFALAGCVVTCYGLVGSLPPTYRYSRSHNHVFETSRIHVGVSLGVACVVVFFPQASPHMMLLAMHSLLHVSSPSGKTVAASDVLTAELRELAGRVGVSLKGVFVEESKEVGTQVSGGYLIVSSGALEELSGQELQFLVAHDLEWHRIWESGVGRASARNAFHGFLIGSVGAITIALGIWQLLVALMVLVPSALWIYMKRSEARRKLAYVGVDATALDLVPGIESAVSAIMKSDYRAEFPEHLEMSEGLRQRLHALRAAHSQVPRGSAANHGEVRLALSDA